MYHEIPEELVSGGGMFQMFNWKGKLCVQAHVEGGKLVICVFFFQ